MDWGHISGILRRSDGVYLLADSECNGDKPSIYPHVADWGGPFVGIYAMGRPVRTASDRQLLNEHIIDWLCHMVCHKRNGEQ